MSKRSRRPNRRNRPKRRRPNRQARATTRTIRLPPVIGFYDADGNTVEFTAGCDACVARIHGQPTAGERHRPLCEFCDPLPTDHKPGPSTERTTDR